MKEKIVLVLGSNGMVGRNIFLYLQKFFPKHVFGTVRGAKNLKENLLLFRTENAHDDFENIKNKLRKIDYIINCIGEKNEKNLERLVRSNSYFPHYLSKIAKKEKINIIHISTDAVFDPFSGKVDEKNIPKPNTSYGMSKLLGEPINKNIINIRTSIIGVHPNKKTGLIQRALKDKNKSREGYINQIWSGCTTLQFSQLCKNIIIDECFFNMVNKSNIYHFVPLGPITKYDLVSCILKSKYKSSNIKELKSEKKDRTLITRYFDILNMDRYTSNVQESITQLFRFEKEVEHEKI